MINIVGDTNPPHFTATPVNTVHISSNNTVADLSVMNASYTGTAGTYTIEDDLTGVHISDNSVAMYALGEKVNGGYARFTTSPSVPTWASGTGTPPSSTTCAREVYIAAPELHQWHVGATPFMDALTVLDG